MLLILSGPVHSGKTSLLRRLLPKLKEQGILVDGFLSPAVVINGETIGYDFFDLKDEKTIPYIRREGESGWQQVGPFFLIPEVLEQAKRKILRHDDSRMLIIDEVGPLEIQGEGTWPALSAVLAKPAVRCLVVVRSSALDLFLERVGQRPAKIFDIESPDVSTTLWEEIKISGSEE
jgi:nucleoside-triphosphatase THEP1